MCEDLFPTELNITGGPFPLRISTRGDVIVGCLRCTCEEWAALTLRQATEKGGAIGAKAFRDYHAAIHALALAHRAAGVRHKEKASA